MCVSPAANGRNLSIGMVLNVGHAIQVSRDPSLDHTLRCHQPSPEEQNTCMADPRQASRRARDRFFYRSEQRGVTSRGGGQHRRLLVGVFSTSGHLVALLGSHRCLSQILSYGEVFLQPRHVARERTRQPISRCFVETCRSAAH